jgi:hypothetical protein
LCYAEESKGDTQDAAVRLYTYIFLLLWATFGVGGEGWVMDALAVYVLAVVGIGTRQGRQSLVNHEEATVPMG